MYDGMTKWLQSCIDNTNLKATTEYINTVSKNKYRNKKLRRGRKSKICINLIMTAKVVQYCVKRLFKKSSLDGAMKVVEGLTNLALNDQLDIYVYRDWLYSLIEDDIYVTNIPRLPHMISQYLEKIEGQTFYSMPYLSEFLSTAIMKLDRYYNTSTSLTLRESMTTNFYDWINGSMPSWSEENIMWFYKEYSFEESLDVILYLARNGLLRVRPELALKGLSILTNLAHNDSIEIKIFNQWLDCFIEIDINDLEKTIPELSNTLKCHLIECIKSFNLSHPPLCKVMTRALLKLNALKEKQPISAIKNTFTKWFIASMRESAASKMTLEQSLDGYKKLNITFMPPELLINCVKNGFSKVIPQEVTKGLHILTNLVKEDLMDFQSYKYWLISFVEMDHLDLIQDMSMLPKIIREYISITVDGFKSTHPELYEILDEALSRLNQPKKNTAKQMKMSQWLLSCMRLIESGSMTLEHSTDSVFELQLKSMTSEELNLSIKTAFKSATPQQVGQGFCIITNLFNEKEMEESKFMSWIDQFIQEDMLDISQHIPQIRHIFRRHVEIMREKNNLKTKQACEIFMKAGVEAEVVNNACFKFNYALKRELTKWLPTSINSIRLGKTTYKECVDSFFKMNTSYITQSMFYDSMREGFSQIKLDDLIQSLSILPRLLIELTQENESIIRLFKYWIDNFIDFDFIKYSELHPDFTKTLKSFILANINSKVSSRMVHIMRKELRHLHTVIDQDEAYTISLKFSNWIKSCARYVSSGNSLKHVSWTYPESDNKLISVDVLCTSVSLAFRFNSHKMIASGVAVLLTIRGIALNSDLFDEWFEIFTSCDLENLFGVPPIKINDLKELIICFIKSKQKVGPELLKSYKKALNY
eukprot:GHVL01036187.1.p1 GENE.GHVL01036187.1~~GHVL01036187.1.p1  ORF type:complete len:874 (+),score=110.77 GHVL01036187.1:462-3083(+)